MAALTEACCPPVCDISLCTNEVHWPRRLCEAVDQDGAAEAGCDLQPRVDDYTRTGCWVHVEGGPVTCQPQQHFSCPSVVITSCILICSSSWFLCTGVRSYSCTVSVLLLKMLPIAPYEQTPPTTSLSISSNSFRSVNQHGIFAISSVYQGSIRHFGSPNELLPLHDE